MNVMQPIASEIIPQGETWYYEVKYDGFRAVLTWEVGHVSIISRNGKDLTNNFPEIVQYCYQNEQVVEQLLPLQLDGELVILNTLLQSNFSLLQQRGRYKTTSNINKAATERPAHFLCFDILSIKGKNTQQESFKHRKMLLDEVFHTLELPYPITWNARLGQVSLYQNNDELWDELFTHKGEGLVAKRLTSKYIDGKAHNDWFKIKNWRTIQGFIVQYDTNNGYFDLGVFDDDKVIIVGKFKHRLEGENLETIKQLLMSKGTKQGQFVKLPPAICVDINCLHVGEGEFREPEFKQFRFDIQPADCTINQLQWGLAMFPEHIDITKREKIFYGDVRGTKGDLLLYLRNIAAYMLPFLKERALTVIRCPDGVDGESFFQKHLPDYAPDYVAGIKSGDGTLLHCGSLEALLWLGNHGALEYHVPFQKMGAEVPTEIVFDLDPPDLDSFELAIFAAQLVKQILDKFELTSYIKTSGNKGLQVYIPIPDGSLTYEDTAAFTHGIAQLLVSQYPDHFTIERMKKNRNNRLYIDYVQHGKDKTLIAPYSPRINQHATVSTPLFWEEVKEGLTPNQFTIQSVIQRVKNKGCPFSDYYQKKDSQNLQLIRDFISNIK